MDFLITVSVFFSSLAIAFGPTLIIVFLIYGIFQLVFKEYLDDRTVLIIGSIIYFIIFLFTIFGPYDFFKNELIKELNNFSFSSLNFYDVLEIIVNIVFAFFSAGFVACILLDLIPFFRRIEFKFRRIHLAIQIFLLIIYFIGFLTAFIYFNN